MAKTTIREYGTSVIAGSRADEEIVPALGNGAAVPGDLVSIGSNRRVAPTKTGTTDLFTGILMESQITGLETAIVAGIPCDVVVPKSGHRYRIRCLDLGVGGLEIGGSLDFSATDYKADKAADVIHGVMRAAKPIADDDTVAEVRWG